MCIRDSLYHRRYDPRLNSDRMDARPHCAAHTLAERVSRCLIMTVCATCARGVDRGAPQCLDFLDTVYSEEDPDGEFAGHLSCPALLTLVQRPHSTLDVLPSPHQVLPCRLTYYATRASSTSPGAAQKFDTCL
eukprot:425516-Prymnesium_polylepis.1